MTRDLITALERGLAAYGQPSSDHDLNAAPWARPHALRPASVLVAMRPSAEGGEVVLTRRAAHLRHHPGQIAFPGGRQDAGDADATATALREAQEEIGLAPAALRLIGTLPPHETVTGYQVTPVLAEITGDFDPRPDPSEVAEIFTAPLPHLLTPARYRVERRMWRGSVRRYYVVPWGPYYIWGATARILRGLADRVGP